MHKPVPSVGNNMTMIIFLLLSTFPSFIFSISTTSFTILPLPSNVTSPESVVFDLFGGGPYTGASDGRVFKYERITNTFVEFSHTSPYRIRRLCDGIDDLDKSPVCGLPLGLDFDYRTGRLFACDPFIGLTAVGALGGLAMTLVPTKDGNPYHFLVGVHVTANGTVLFTDASSHFGPKDVEKSIQTGDSTAKFLKYDPVTGKVEELLAGMAGAVGVATDRDATFALVSEFIAKRIRRYWLKGEKAGTSEIFMTFAGGPNKIKRNLEGDFWVAVNNLNNDSTVSPQGVKINSYGQVLATVDLSKEYNRRITIVHEQAGKLYVGGRSFTFVGRYDIVH